MKAGAACTEHLEGVHTRSRWSAAAEEARTGPRGLGGPGQPGLDGGGARVGWGLLRDRVDGRGADWLTCSEHALMFLLLY